VDTLTKPDYVTHDASHDRLELLQEANAVELGLDASQTAQAQNSLEKMLAHEMAATHRVIMKLIGQVNAQLEAMSENLASPSLVRLEANKFLHGEIGRTAGTIARLQIAQQQGMLTLQRLRSGGWQTVRVEHVQLTQVGEGGKAIVAGKVTRKEGGASRCKLIIPRSRLAHGELLALHALHVV
jgi:hypothetical protein